MEGGLGLCPTGGTERVVWGIRPVAQPLISSLNARLSTDAPDKGRLVFPWHPILPTQIGSVHGDGDDTQQCSKILLFCRSSGWCPIHVRITT